jgi:hypothetical protein
MIREVLIAVCAVAIGGCDTPSPLERQTRPERAEFGDQLIAVPPEPRAEMVRSEATAAGEIASQEVTGIWTFTTPPTVTRIERKNGDIDQFTLYNGQPAPTDTPFLVITVSRSQKSIAEAEPATYKISSQRDYSMNGGLVHEWIGQTSSGAGFCELMIRRPGAAGETGDLCHAMALARTDEEQKLALAILASIVWKPSR